MTLETNLYLQYFTRWKKGELPLFGKPTWVCSKKTGKRVLSVASMHRFQKNYMLAISHLYPKRKLKSVLKKGTRRKKKGLQKKVRFSKKISKKT